jgi:hypothetical protein
VPKTCRRKYTVDHDIGCISIGDLFQTKSFVPSPNVVPYSKMIVNLSPLDTSTMETGRAYSIVCKRGRMLRQSRRRATGSSVANVESLVILFARHRDAKAQ